jgi:hypothetical protein
MNSPSPTTAIVVFLGATAAVLALTAIWAIANRRPIRSHRHLTGRSAVPYSHSPSPTDLAAGEVQNSSEANGTGAAT